LPSTVFFSGIMAFSFGADGGCLDRGVAGKGADRSFQRAGHILTAGRARGNATSLAERR
jgi:hypothetical protein